MADETYRRQLAYTFRCRAAENASSALNLFPVAAAFDRSRKVRLPPLVLADIDEAGIDLAATPALFELVNVASGAFTHVGVDEFTARDDGDEAIVSAALRTALGLAEGELVDVRLVTSLPLATGLALEPQQRVGASISRALLQPAIEAMPAATVGDSFDVVYGRERYTYRVVAVEPASHEAVRLLGATDISIEWRASPADARGGAKKRPLSDAELAVRAQLRVATRSDSLDVRFARLGLEHSGTVVPLNDPSVASLFATSYLHLRRRIAWFLSWYRAPFAERGALGRDDTFDLLAVNQRDEVVRGYLMARTAAAVASRPTSNLETRLQEVRERIARFVAEKKPTVALRLQLRQLEQARDAASADEDDTERCSVCSESLLGAADASKQAVLARAYLRTETRPIVGFAHHRVLSDDDDRLDAVRFPVDGNAAIDFLHLECMLFQVMSQFTVRVYDHSNDRFADECYQSDRESACAIPGMRYFSAERAPTTIAFDAMPEDWLWSALLTMPIAGESVTRARAFFQMLASIAEYGREDAQRAWANRTYMVLRARLLDDEGTSARALLRRAVVEMLGGYPDDLQAAVPSPKQLAPRFMPDLDSWPASAYKYAAGFASFRPPFMQLPIDDTERPLVRVLLTLYSIAFFVPAWNSVTIDGVEEWPEPVTGPNAIDSAFEWVSGGDTNVPFSMFDVVIGEITIQSSTAEANRPFIRITNFASESRLVTGVIARSQIDFKAVLDDMIPGSEGALEELLNEFDATIARRLNDAFPGDALFAAAARGLSYLPPYDGNDYEDEVYFTLAHVYGKFVRDVWNSFTAFGSSIAPVTRSFDTFGHFTFDPNAEDRTLKLGNVTLGTFVQHPIPPLFAIAPDIDANTVAALVVDGRFAVDADGRGRGRINLFAFSFAALIAHPAFDNLREELEERVEQAVGKPRTLFSCMQLTHFRAPYEHVALDDLSPLGRRLRQAYMAFARERWTNITIEGQETLDTSVTTVSSLDIELEATWEDNTHVYVDGAEVGNFISQGEGDDENAAYFGLPAFDEFDELAIVLATDADNVSRTRLQRTKFPFMSIVDYVPLVRTYYDDESLARRANAYDAWIARLDELVAAYTQAPRTNAALSGPKRAVDETTGYLVVLAIESADPDFYFVAPGTRDLVSFRVPRYEGNDVFAYRDVMAVRVRDFFRPENMAAESLVRGYTATPEALVIYLTRWDAIASWTIVPLSDLNEYARAGLDSDGYPRSVMPTARYPARRLFCTSENAPLFIDRAFLNFLEASNFTSRTRDDWSLEFDAPKLLTNVWQYRHMNDEHEKEQQTYLYHGLDNVLPFGYRIDAYSWYTPQFRTARRFMTWQSEKAAEMQPRVYRYQPRTDKRLRLLRFLRYPRANESTEIFETHFGELESLWPKAGSYQMTDLVLRYTSFDGWTYDEEREPQLALFHPVADTLVVDSYLPKDSLVPLPVRSNRRNEPTDDAFFVQRAVYQESVESIAAALDMLPSAKQMLAMQRALNWLKTKQPRIVTSVERWWTSFLYLSRRYIEQEGKDTIDIAKDLFLEDSEIHPDDVSQLTPSLRTEALKWLNGPRTAARLMRILMLNPTSEMSTILLELFRSSPHTNKAVYLVFLNYQLSELAIDVLLRLDLISIDALRNDNEYPQTLLSITVFARALLLGKNELVTTMLALGFDPWHEQFVLNAVLKSDNVASVKMMLVVPSQYKLPMNNVLVLAAKKNAIDIVTYLLHHTIITVELVRHLFKVVEVHGLVYMSVALFKNAHVREIFNNNRDLLYPIIFDHIRLTDNTELIKYLLTLEEFNPSKDTIDFATMDYDFVAKITMYAWKHQMTHLFDFFFRQISVTRRVFAEMLIAPWSARMDTLMQRGRGDFINTTVSVYEGADVGFRRITDEYRASLSRSFLVNLTPTTAEQEPLYSVRVYKGNFVDGNMLSLKSRFAQALPSLLENPIVVDAFAAASVYGIILDEERAMVSPGAKPTRSIYYDAITELLELVRAYQQMRPWARNLLDNYRLPFAKAPSWARAIVVEVVGAEKLAEWSEPTTTNAVLSGPKRSVDEMETIATITANNGESFTVRATDAVRRLHLYTKDDGAYAGKIESSADDTDLSLDKVIILSEFQGIGLCSRFASVALAHTLKNTEKRPKYGYVDIHSYQPTAARACYKSAFASVGYAFKESTAAIAVFYADDASDERAGMLVESIEDYEEGRRIGIINDVWKESLLFEDTGAAMSKLALIAARMRHPLGGGAST
jgi:hypothetical protein